MSFSKITQVFRRTVFPTHFVTRRVQCLQSPKSDLFHLSFSRRTLANERPKSEYLNSQLEAKNLPKSNIRTGAVFLGLDLIYLG